MYPVHIIIYGKMVLNASLPNADTTTSTLYSTNYAAARHTWRRTLLLFFSSRLSSISIYRLVRNTVSSTQGCGGGHLRSVYIFHALLYTDFPMLNGPSFV
jgi:hypothetical protein